MNGQNPNPVVVGKRIMAVQRRWMKNVDYEQNNNKTPKRSDLIISK